MANFIDLLKGIKSKIGSNKVNVEPVQMAENGGLDIQATMELAQRQPKTPFERIFGRNIEIDTDTTNPTTGEITTERVTKFQPGMLNDIASGARENYTQGFSPYNLQDNIGTEGQNKGLAYRIGEGAGTLGRGLRRVGGALGRFADTPLGRAAIMAGVVGATGGSGLQALAYGGTAGLGNQVNRMNDSLYRRDLEAQGIDTSNIRGYIGKDTYQNLINSRIAQENAAYRRMYYDVQAEQGKQNQQLAQEKFDHQKEQDAIENAQKWAEINNDKNNKKGGRIMPASSATGLSGTQQGINQMTTLMEQIPKFAKRGLAGPVGSLRRFNPYDADAQAFQQYVNTYKQVIGKGLEGGVLRKEDEAKYEKIIPRMGDTEEVLMRKAQQLQQMLVEKYNTDLESLYNAGYDTGNFSYLGGQSVSNNSKSGVTKSGVKYEVIE